MSERPEKEEWRDPEMNPLQQVRWTASCLFFLAVAIVGMAGMKYWQDELWLDELIVAIGIACFYFSCALLSRKYPLFSFSFCAMVVIAYAVINFDTITNRGLGRLGLILFVLVNGIWQAYELNKEEEEYF